jgi:hypothetical protein
MGGGQTNSAQASTAANQQTAANNQDMALSAQYGGQEKQIFNSLFGNGSTGSTGTLSGMMNPANLTQTGLNPAYQAQFNQGINQIGQSTAQQKGALAQSFANSGATGNSTPSGFQADQMRQLGSSQADAQGQLYSGLMGQQYNSALNNFWNANNIAAGGQGSATSGSTSGAGNAGSSSAQIYGTAGQQTPGALNSALGAAGAVGAGAASAATKAACPCAGSMILMADGSEKAVEQLVKGDLLRAISGGTCAVESTLPCPEPVFAISTSDGCTVEASSSHTLVTPENGFVAAFEALARIVMSRGGPTKVTRLVFLGKHPVFDILTDGDHSYCANGLWAFGNGHAESDAYLAQPEIVEMLQRLEGNS